ncbi:MAG TPA: ATP-binding cassette domain-containing protein [Acidimicrobiales bacterium]|nr:ATP-binding cassette domain-containing protein [Acidimicrobiales bacterium]
MAGRQLLLVDSLDIEAGELVVVAGDAGTGKTLLSAALCGAQNASGSVLLSGKQLSGPPSRRRTAGLAATLRDGTRITGCNVDEALAVATRDPHRRRRALEHFPALAGRRTLPAQLLSGGEQQMLQIACAWCAGAPVLVLDSPTVGLTADVAAAVAELAQQEAEGGAAVVWLEQDSRAQPTQPVHRLREGRLGPVTAAVPPPA